MNKRSEPLFQKSNFLPPGSDKFLNFITLSKTFELSLGVAGKRILTLSALSRSCQFLPLSDRTNIRDKKNETTNGVLRIIFFVFRKLAASTSRYQRWVTSLWPWLTLLTANKDMFRTEILNSRFC